MTWADAVWLEIWRTAYRHPRNGVTRQQLWATLADNIETGVVTQRAGRASILLGLEIECSL